MKDLDVFRYTGMAKRRKDGRDQSEIGDSPNSDDLYH